MPVKGKIPVKGNGKQGDGKGGKSNWRAPCDDSGSPAVAHKDTIVQSIIQDDNQVDVQSVALLVNIHLNAHVQSSLKLRMPSWMRLHGSRKKSNGKTLSWRLTSMRRSRERKAKGKGLSPKGSLKVRVPQGRLHLDQHSLNLRTETDPNPKPNPKHALA